MCIKEYDRSSSFPTSYINQLTKHPNHYFYHGNTQNKFHTSTIRSMNSLTVTMFAAFLAFVAGATVSTGMKTSSRITEAAAAEIRRKVDAAGGCNANVCFAIDGSGNIPAEAFVNEKNFVLDIASLIGVDEVAELSAVQYATGLTAISPLTVDSAAFITSVDGTEQMEGESFMVGGMNYCFSQLYKLSGEALKIVILGDGKSTIGSNTAERADLFRSLGGSVSVVGAGDVDSDALNEVADSAAHVFTVESFMDALALQELVDTLVSFICVK